MLSDASQVNLVSVQYLVLPPVTKEPGREGTSLAGCSLPDTCSILGASHVTCSRLIYVVKNVSPRGQRRGVSPGPIPHMFQRFSSAVCFWKTACLFRLFSRKTFSVLGAEVLLQVCVCGGGRRVRTTRDIPSYRTCSLYFFHNLSQTDHVRPVRGSIRYSSCCLRIDPAIGCIQPVCRVWTVREACACSRSFGPCKSERACVDLAMWGQFVQCHDK